LEEKKERKNRHSNNELTTTQSSSKKEKPADSSSGKVLAEIKQRRFECKYCHAAFKTEDFLKGHIDRRHSGISTQVKGLQDFIKDQFFVQRGVLKEDIDRMVTSSLTKAMHMIIGNEISSWTSSTTRELGVIGALNNPSSSSSSSSSYRNNRFQEKSIDIGVGKEHNKPPSPPSSSSSPLLFPEARDSSSSLPSSSVFFETQLFRSIFNTHTGRASSSSSSQRFPPSRATFYRSLLKENNDNYAESVERGDDEGGDAPNKKQPGGDHGETARVNDDMLLLLSNGERKDGKRRRAFVKKERRSTDNSIVAARVFELMADQSPSDTLMNNKEGGSGRMIDVRKLGRQEENEEEEEGGQEETVRNTDIIAIRDIEFRSVLRHLLRNCYDNLGTVENEYLNRDAVQMVVVVVEVVVVVIGSMNNISVN